LTNLTNASITFNISTIATITLAVDALYIGGLDTWQDIALFNASDPTRLDTNTDLAELDIILALSLDVSLPGQAPLQESFNVSFTMVNGTLDLVVDLLISTSRSNALIAGQIFQGPCLLSTLDTITLPWFHLNFTVTDLALTPTSGAAERDLDQAIDDLLSLFITGFDNVIPYILDAGLVELAATVSRSLNHSASSASCPQPATKHSDDATNMLVTYVGCSVAICLSVVFALYLRRALEKSSRAGSPRSSGEDMPLLASEAVAPCLAAEKSVPTLARYGIPLLLLGTVALLMFSNTSAGADVYPALYIKGNRFAFEPLFTFSLVNTIKDMWKADAIPLSLVVAVFSGAWPYIKLLFMLTAWLCPTRWLKEGSRETMLRILDALGKWSLIDTYVMVMMLVAFRFHIPLLPKEIEDGHGVTSLDIFVRPDVGFHTFVIATVVSLVLSHVLLYFHRRAADHHIHPEPATTPQAFGWHVYQGSDGEQYRFTWCGFASVVLMLLGTISIVLVGAIVPAFSFNFKGLAAGALDFEHDAMGYTNEHVLTNYSLVEVGEAIATSYEYPSQFAIRYIQVVFFLFALAVPVTHLLVMTIAWTYPMLPKTQRVYFLLAETLNAWAGIDVFFISVVAAILQIEKFAQFIIGDNCNGINVLVAKLIDNGVLPPNMEATCFDVVAELKGGMFLLGAALVMSIVTSLFVMPLCHQALDERLHAGKYAKLHTVQSMVQVTSKHHSSCCCNSLRLATRLGLMRQVEYEA
jgi:hypothetical protein